MLSLGIMIVMNFVYELFNQLYIFINYWMFARFFRVKEKYESKTKRVTALFSVYFFFIFMSYVRNVLQEKFEAVGLFSIFYIAVLFVVLSKIFEGSFAKKLMLYIAQKVFEIISVTISSSIVVNIVNCGLIEYIYGAAERETTAVNAVLAGFFAALKIETLDYSIIFAQEVAFVYFIKFCIKNKNRLHILSALLLIPISGILLSSFYYIKKDQVNFIPLFGGKSTDGLAIFSFAMGVIGYLFLVYIVLNLNKMNEAEKELHVYEETKGCCELIESQQKTIEEMKNNIKEQIHTLKQYILADDEEKVYGCLNAIKGRKRLTKLYYCDNVAINSVLVNVCYKCEQKGIKAYFKVFLRKKFGVNDFDMVTLISNILDNAMEATLELPEDQREISFIANENRGCVVIACDNTCCAGRGKTYLDSRKMSHGNGAAIIKKTVAKYDGTVKYEKTDSNFETRVLLYKK